MTAEEKLAETISNGVNVMGQSPEAFAAAMGRQHRTLQQNFTRFCFAWIRHLAKLEENQYDLRNEASVKACREIVQRTGESSSFLPFI
jgi:hypothetical protein